MPIYKCSKCLPFTIPDDWTIEKKTEIGNLVRKYGRFSSIFYFKPTSMKLIDAKGLVLHINMEKGFCKCKTEVIQYEGTCPKCKSLYLNW